MTPRIGKGKKGKKNYRGILCNIIMEKERLFAFYIVGTSGRRSRRVGKRGDRQKQKKKKKKDPDG